MDGAYDCHGANAEEKTCGNEAFSDGGFSVALGELALGKLTQTVQSAVDVQQGADDSTHNYGNNGDKCVGAGKSTAYADVEDTKGNALHYYVAYLLGQTPFKKQTNKGSRDYRQSVYDCS